MPKIKNGGLDQYGKVYSLNGIGDERVNGIGLPFCCRPYTPISILFGVLRCESGQQSLTSHVGSRSFKVIEFVANRKGIILHTSG